MGAGSVARPGNDQLAARIAHSAAARAGRMTTFPEFHRWFAGYAEQSYADVEPVALEDLVGWRIDPVSGGLVHDSGRFFEVQGIEVHHPGAVVPRWRQPIIDQPETGILGILVAEFDGVPHFLMQAKVEPGNCNGLQLSPTVQATRSNYTRAHGGRSVPYVEYFRDFARHTVLADVRQSEQGSWFYRKRNRNMIVEVSEPVEVLDGFRWLTLGQIHELLALDDVVNMDSRTVLSCLPFPGSGRPGDEAGSLHTTGEILSWITDLRSGTDLRVRPVPLDQVTGWRWRDGRLGHDSGLFFEVMGVRVRARGREVNQWTQPMIAAERPGVAAFLTRRIGGVTHVLMQAKVTPGYVDGVELAPTVQCAPHNYGVLPARARPPFLDEVLDADPRRIRFDTMLSEEGGRFYHTRNRYLVIETDQDREDEHPDFRWVAVHQLADLLRHSYYLNVEARTLVACLRSLG
ncbi:NDP-hexose 2,3-dehydratase family protein [Streptomyces sp. SID2888]|uniref:NDP-hexose 2,3-dehydratase family protein n=1 Tax=Streptomyces sp. SID2888 TaxID=2690256 RepID=UPI00136E0276|nr:NDP-hexose 2,3-dehydratase family protein [Streptomyces sp. SID2888]MYV49629.1 NDP-hexose 2,3-dehydratase [Streptomyces sp. SID2888]